MPDPITPVAAEGLRERIDDVIADWATNPRGRHLGDLVVAALAGDSDPDLPALMAEAILRARFGDEEPPASQRQEAGRVAAAASGVRDEHLVYMTARAVYAEGQLSARRDHETRWELEKARADKAEYDLEIRTDTARSNGRAHRYAYLESEKQRERADQAEAERDALKAAIERARAEHRPVSCGNARHDGGEGLHCAVCEYDDVEGNIWPCPTIAALAAPETPGDAETKPKHIGRANAEDCPACDTTTMPYPWICPGEPESPEDAEPRPGWREVARARVGDRVAARMAELMAEPPLSAEEFDEAMRRNKVEAEAHLDRQSRGISETTPDAPKGGED
jgi:hypothetical protein